MRLDRHFHRTRLPAALLTLMLLVLMPAAAQAQAAATANGTDPAIGRSRGLVTLNFVNAEVEAVSKAIGVMIGRNILVDPRVRGQISVASDQPQSVREAYQSFLAALRGLGFAVVDSGGLLKVVPEADAKLQAGTVSVGEVALRGDQVITQIFPLRFENANNLVAVLRPLISANNTINASPGTNSLVITDYAENLARLAKIIAALDLPASTDVEVIPLKNAVAADLAPLVQRLADGSGGGLVIPGAVAAGGGAASVLPDARSNSLIVRASNASRLAALRSLIAKLDVPAAGVGPGGGMWVVHLKNADAVKLATVVRAAFAAIGTGTTGSGAGGAVAAPIATAPAAPAALATGQSAATAPIAASAQPSTGGFIQADPATNSLIITAPEPLYRQVRAMIEQLDTRRAQVYIESLIVEVVGDNAADFGIQWQGVLGKDGDANIGLIGTNLASATRSSGVASIVDITAAAADGKIPAIGAGLNLGLVHKFGGQYALAAIAKLMQSQSNTNIMSTPNLITLDNEEAKIVVGDNVPFITGQFTSTGTGTNNPFQTIERKDVGLTLRIKPQIGESGSIRMTIFQESSSVGAPAAGTTGTGPTTSKRSIESNVVVDDGQILVLGGLIEDRYEDNKTKVPVLGDIPVLGGLFRSESRTRKRTNLMVFLRPIVMRTAEDANKLSIDRYDLMRTQQQSLRPDVTPVLPIDAPGGTPFAPGAKPLGQPGTKP